MLLSLAVKEQCAVTWAKGRVGNNNNNDNNNNSGHFCNAVSHREG